GAIPPLGRQVRCAACKHSWHQEPDDRPAEEAAPADEPEVDEAETVNEERGQPEERPDEPAEEHSEAAAPDYETIGESEPTADEEEDESLTEATLIEPRAGPEAEQRAYEEAMLE